MGFAKNAGAGQKKVDVARLGSTIGDMNAKSLLIALVALGSVTAAAGDEPIVVKVTDGRADTYTVSGMFQRSFGSGNVLQAVTNGQEVALLLTSGRVDLYRRDGMFLRSFGSGEVTGVQIAADTVALTRKDGRVDIYGLDGSFKRSL